MFPFSYTEEPPAPKEHEGPIFIDKKLRKFIQIRGHKDGIALCSFPAPYYYGVKFVKKEMSISMEYLNKNCIPADNLIDNKLVYYFDGDWEVKPKKGQKKSSAKTTLSRSRWYL